MKTNSGQPLTEERRRLEGAYSSERGVFLSRLRAAGRSLEEAEDIVHDVYAEVMERLPLIAGIGNLPAWINSLFARRVIDAWRRDRTRARSGETRVSEETLREIVDGIGIDPADACVRESLVDALNTAIAALPAPQRSVIEAQVFGNKTFREIAESTGESLDTLTARKRYAVANLARALRHWIDD